MRTHNLNSDLIWQVGGFNYPELIFSFLKRFEDSFCIFSKTVQSLYSNYEIQRTSPRTKTVVALPNPYAFHDTFFNIPEDAILPTGMVISPGEVCLRNNWLLCYKQENSNNWKGMDFLKGMERFRYKYGEDDPLLPVLLNTDLRRGSNTDMPLMHLHRISTKKLDAFSDLQRVDIHATISDKMAAFSGGRLF